MKPPKIYVTDITAKKISDEVNKDRSLVTFIPDKPIRAWDARANGVRNGSGLPLGKSDHLFPSSSIYASDSLVPRNFNHSVSQYCYKPYHETIVMGYDPGWDTTKNPHGIYLLGWSSGYNDGVQDPSLGYHAHARHDLGPDGGTCWEFNDFNSDIGHTHRWLGISQGRGKIANDWHVGARILIAVDVWVDRLEKYPRLGMYHKDKLGSSTFGNQLKDLKPRMSNSWHTLYDIVTIDDDYDLTQDTTLYMYGHHGSEGKMRLANPRLISLDTSPNILLNPSIDDPTWSKGYNTNIVYTEDGPDPSEPTVATFNDASGDGSSYWYSYGDYAPQDPNTDYIIQIWAKTDTGYADISAYTADNSESSRWWSPSIRVNSTDGWKLLRWEFTSPDPNDSDSLSFRFTGTWNALSLSAPRLMKKPEITFEIDNEELQQDDIYRVNMYSVSDDTGEWNLRDLRKVRYIRDHLGYGSTSNGSNHWIEIQAFDVNNTNVALSKYAVNHKGEEPSVLNDGNLDTSQWSSYGMSPSPVNGECWQKIDLGKIYELSSLKIWHYYGDGRTYYNTRTEISVDGVNWETIFNSQISGEYQETSSGNEIKL